MDHKELQAIAQAAAKNIKTQDDLKEFQQMLTKITVEAALNAELDDHLGYIKHEPSDADNARNGYSSKTVQTEEGQFELNTPRDRAGSFNPRLVKKHQRRFTAMDGHKELLGMWLSENEGAKFWLNVLTELQNRGVKDILIACVQHHVIELARLLFFSFRDSGLSCSRHTRSVQNLRN